MTWTLCSVLFCFYAVSRHCLNASINLLFKHFSFLKSWGCGSWFGSPVVSGLCTKLSHGEIQIFRSTLGFLWSEGENHFLFQCFCPEQPPFENAVALSTWSNRLLWLKKRTITSEMCASLARTVCAWVHAFVVTANIFCHGVSYPDYLFVLLFSECLWRKTQ